MAVLWALVEAHEAYAEVHKAYVEAHRAHVEAHKAHVEVHEAHVKVRRTLRKHQRPRDSFTSQYKDCLSINTWISTLLSISLSIYLYF